MEEQWGRVFAHESGHALMAVLQGIACRGIYFDRTEAKFCAVPVMPEPSGYSREHYLILTSGSAAEIIIYGDMDEEGATSDRVVFQNTGAPSLQETVDEAQRILTDKKRQLKRLVSMLKAKCREVNLNLGDLPETVVDGSTHKFVTLIPKEELEDAVQRD